MVRVSFCAFSAFISNQAQVGVALYISVTPCKLLIKLYGNQKNQFPRKKSRLLYDYLHLRDVNSSPKFLSSNCKWGENQFPIFRFGRNIKTALMYSIECI